MLGKFLVAAIGLLLLVFALVFGRGWFTRTTSGPWVGMVRYHWDGELHLDNAAGKKFASRIDDLLTEKA